MQAPLIWKIIFVASIFTLTNILSTTYIINHFRKQDIAKQAEKEKLEAEKLKEEEIKNKKGLQHIKELRSLVWIRCRRAFRFYNQKVILSRATCYLPHASEVFNYSDPFRVMTFVYEEGGARCKCFGYLNNILMTAEVHVDD